MNKADMDNINTIVKVCEGFEPIETFKLNKLTAEGVRVTALVSIAISLKRIADSLENKLTGDKAYEAWKHDNLDYMLKNK